MLISLRGLFAFTTCMLISAATVQADDLPVEIWFSDPAAAKLDHVNQGSYSLSLNIKNTSNERVVMWPYFSAHLLDSSGRLQRKIERVERWKDLKAPSILEAVEFFEIEPGEKMEIKVRINACELEADSVSGWQLPRADDYQLVLRCYYDKSMMKRRYGDGCKSLSDENAPWNQALEYDQKVQVDFTVKP